MKVNTLLYIYPQKSVGMSWPVYRIWKRSEGSPDNAHIERRGQSSVRNTAERKRLGQCWQIKSIFNLSQDEWNILRATYGPEYTPGRVNKYDIDFLKGIGYRTDLTDEKIDWIILATSKVDLLDNHYEMENIIKTSNPRPKKG